jgi:hypothetical protein
MGTGWASHPLAATPGHPQGADAMSRRLTKKQKEWLTHFQKVAGFDAIYIDRYLSGELSFEELTNMNYDWLNDFVNDVQCSCERKYRDLFEPIQPRRTR